MQDLIDYEICIGHALANNVRTCSGDVVGLEVSFQSLQKAWADFFAVLGVGLILLGGEERFDEERTPLQHQ